MTTHEIKKIAQLARIELSDTELKQYARELTDILKYVAQLNEVDTRAVPATAQVTGLTNVFQEDEQEECCIQEQLLDAVPVRQGREVKVKSVF